MIANLMPTEATHSSLDLFEKSSLLETLDVSFVKNWARCIAPLVQCWNLKSLAVETTILIYKKNPGNQI